MSSRLFQPPAVQRRLQAILQDHELSQEHSAAVEAEAAALAADPGCDDPRLLDLQHLPFVTIDYPRSRDLDQAIHLAPGGDGGGWLLRYALADASWFVRPGSALMAEALRRGASYYLAHLCAPMLPRRLCEDIVSLNARVPRRAVVFTLHLDRDALPVRTQVQRARIRSRAKLAYSGVQAWCDDPADSPLRDQEYTPSLEQLQRAGPPLLAAARDRGMVPFHRPEVTWEPPGPTAPGFRIVADQRVEVERWNEQVSLLCNTEGARLMLLDPAPWVQPIFRVHPHPAEQRLAALEKTIRSLVRLHGLECSTWNWRRGQENLADWLARLPDTRQRLRAAIQRQVLHSYERSDFMAEPGPHHALGVPCYGRFTAPMREVVGIFTHKELLEKLGLEPPADSGRDEKLRERVLQAADRSRELQRQLTRAGDRLALDFLLERDMEQPAAQRPQREGTVLGLTRSRIYVRLDEPPLEIKAYTPHLEGTLGVKLEEGDGGLSLGAMDGPRWRVGDAIRLKVAGRDENRDRWRLEPVG